MGGIFDQRRLASITRNEKEKKSQIFTIMFPLLVANLAHFYVSVFSISMKAIQSAMCAHFPFRNPELCLSAKGSVTDDSKKWPDKRCMILSNIVGIPVFHYLLVWG